MGSGSLLACPDCRKPFKEQEGQYTCASCNARHPAWLGIVSLIQRSEQSLDPTTRRLLDAYTGASFDDLLKLRTPTFSTTDPKLVERYQAYRKNMMERGRAFYEMARSSAEARGTTPGRTCAIALGCGVGASMVAMARDFTHVIGVDPSLPDLVLARKACEEFGIANVTLVHGYGERMPVASGSVDIIIAENVLEHVPDLEPTFEESRRVLRPGALFVGDCANRYNLLRPEPHVQLWGVGLLPRKWQAAYVMRRRNFEGYDRSVHLKSYGQLLTAMRSKLGAESTLEFPKAVAFGFSKRIDDALRLIDRIPVVRTMLLSIFPVFVAVGRRSRN